MTGAREAVARVTAAGGAPGESVLAVDIGGIKLAAAHADASRAGHPVARAACERAGRGPAAAIASAAALCDLDRVVIGGGVSRFWDVLEPPLSRALNAYAGLAFARRAEAVPSELGGEAALLGAAALAREPELV